MVEKIFDMVKWIIVLFTIVFLFFFFIYLMGGFILWENPFTKMFHDFTKLCNEIEGINVRIIIFIVVVMAYIFTKNGWRRFIINKRL